ncbi:PREDICTED: uncharacterized protein LOC107348500 isoform X2 [Acropora digitifera]|uniref:uncharacterized protein LOC107348500 isoform X2 n=1 Tax=Acropora digitifera TaxID=70779 RepID=UPI00077A1350|nr:PREDICTED: uncharacterized protein LOC107348500 isoform X2 [Acropora digitifera]
MRSVGKINTTVNTNFSEIKTATTKPPAVVMRNLLQAVIPGILAGVLLIFLALLLFYLSRKIGIIRVGANRSEAVEGAILFCSFNINYLPYYNKQVSRASILYDEDI